MTTKLTKLINYSDFINRETKRKSGSKFYYVTDIKYTLRYYNIDNKRKKGDLLKWLYLFYNQLDKYKKYESQIILIQKIFRGYKTRKIDIHKGPGFFNTKLCKNDEDFYSIELINQIPKYYLFSYRDSLNNTWGFDIRSFIKLINTKSNNPYTREPIPLKVKEKVRIIIENLKKKGILIKYKDEKLTPEQEFNNRLVSIFQKIDELNVSAGGTDISWFKDLSIHQLKSFYIFLEDIWNYRAELTLDEQKNIVPDGDILNVPKQQIKSIKNIKILRNILLNHIDKLISSSDYEHHRITGAYYVLIALCEVSPICANSMPWLIMSNIS